MLAGVPTPDADLPRLELTDSRLIELSVGEPFHFATLFDRHADAVHRYLSRRVGDLADDLLGDTFLIAFRQRRTYEPSHVTVLPWLYGIATNLIRGHHRHESRRYRALAEATGERDTSSTTADTDARIDAQSLRGALAGALAGLKQLDRDVLLLFAWGQLSYEEIAAVQSVPIGTVRSRLHRARRQTRAALGAAVAISEEEL